jgi:3-oxoadipate enol-lactonase
VRQEVSFATASDGAQLAWWSTGAGTPLVLLNAQSSDHRMWDAVVPELARHHRVITFDTRGTGESENGTDAGYSTQGFATDAVAVLDAAEVDRAHAWGISMGGRVAQWLGVSHPDRVGALVLCSTTPGDAHGVPRSPEVSAMMAAPSARQRRLLEELQHSPSWRARHPGPSYGAPPSAAVQRLHFGASQAHDAWDHLPSIGTPVLVVHGDDDQVNVPANAELLAARIPGARLLLVGGGRHLVHDEHADVVLPAVLGLLAAHPL